MDRRYETARISMEIINQFKSRSDDLRLPELWRFGWNRGRRMLAKCHYRKHIISISSHFAAVATDEQIKESILHEIAHALAGYKAGHGPVWKTMCIRVGAKPQRCASYEEVKNMPSRFTGTCPNCGAIFKAHRRLKNMERRMCRKRACKASGKYVTWETNHVPLTKFM